MGFKSVMKRIGKGALKVGKVAVPIALAATGVGIPAAIAASAALNAADTKASGGSWKQALISGGIGAGTAAIPGGGGIGSSLAGGATKAGMKSLITGAAKGAATNFAAGAGTSLATGQGVKNALKAGGTSALTNLGAQGTGGFGTAAKAVGKNVAVNAGGQLAAKGLQQAGVPGVVAEQGGNVFSNYLGGKFNSQPKAQTTGFGASARPGGVSGINFTAGAPTTAPIAPTTGGAGWKGQLANAGVGLAQQYLGNKMAGGTTQPPYSLSAAPGGPGQSTVNTGLPGQRTYDMTQGGINPGSDGPIPVGQLPASTGPYSATGQTGGEQQAPTTPANPNQPKSWSDTWGPVLTQAGGVAAGAIAGKIATGMAQKRSPEEQAALTGAQGAAGNLGQYGNEAWRSGRETLQAPGQYFKTLLSGNRAAMSQAIAGPAAQLTGNYRGAARALDQQGVRGAARDVAVADLNRDRVSKIAGLTTGMQPYAAEQLKSLGETQQALAPGMLGTSGSIYSGLLGQGANNRAYARQEGEKTAKAIGGLARSAGEAVYKKGQPTPTTKDTATTTPQSGAAQPPPPMPVTAPTTPAVQGGTATAPRPVTIGPGTVKMPTFGGVPAPAAGYPSANVKMPAFGKNQVYAFG
ncbi:MAG TPA: hypothetical protein VFY43_05500 [Candidatus Limnocylindria bacterium]|nr:hypothetical protein [Candidatus Limnocylindria bacterium]